MGELGKVWLRGGGSRGPFVSVSPSRFDLSAVFVER